MKTYIFLIFMFIIFSSNTLLLSQEQKDCATEVPEGVTIEQAISRNLDFYKNIYLTQNQGLNLRLAVHVVKMNNGFTNLSEEELNRKLNKLNFHFSQTNISFYVYIRREILSDAFYNIDNLEEANSLRQNNFIPGCINIFFVNQILIDGQGAQGFSSFSPRIDSGPQGILITNTAYETTLPHEMGHYFDLFHTETITFGIENILRSENPTQNPCVNCDRAGDLICDTPADPSFRFFRYKVTEDCNWEPFGTPPPDGCGMNNYSPSMINMMQVSTQQCRSEFTVQQIARIYETLYMYRQDLLSEGHLVYVENRFNNENAGGFISINEQQYPSGSYVQLPTGEYTIKTNNERFSNYKGRGFTIKHNNWNDNLEKHFLDKIIFVDSSQIQLANFLKLNYAKIECRLEGLNLPNMGRLQFQDPWYVKADGSQPGNYWITAYGQYEPNGKEGAQEKGVFLDQGYNPINHIWQPPYYSLKVDQIQYLDLPHTGRTERFYFLNWSAEPAGGAIFQNSNELETPVVFKQDGVNINANYKGSLLTNNRKAISNNSQRKVIRTMNNNIHVFYVSEGGLWYEKSVNNGSTFYKPKLILSDVIIKSFSVDYVENKIYMVVHFSDGDNAYLYFLQIDENANISDFGISFIHLEDREVDAMPVVGATYDNILFVWKNSRNEGLKLLRIRLTGNAWESRIISIPNTTGRSINPSISSVKCVNCSRLYSHLIWEEKESSRSSKLYYYRIMNMWNNVNDIRFENFQEISRGSGYELTTSPTIVEQGDNQALIGFIGKKRFEAENLTPEETKAVLTFVPSSGVFYSFGDDVQSVNVNRSNERWTFAWTMGNDYSVQFVDSRDLRRVWQLSNLKGVDVQITNGINATDMMAFVINTKVSPYPIYYRAIYGEQIPIDLVVTEDSREGVVDKDGGAVYYSMGDIKVGDQKIEFVELPDTLSLITLNNANRYLISKPFMVNDYTGFVYSIKYGVTDSTALKEALTGTDYIKFRVELIDYNTKELLGVFDEVEYNSNNVSKYENINYYVNTEGLGERMVQLRLVISNNVDPYYSISDKFSDAGYSLQKKKSLKQIGYRGLLSAKEYTYALHQNYPNPFNPMTRIKYSVKEEKLVTIKLYDMLGREVTTLINEVKSPGEYELELDGGKLGLSSGVYLYQMRSEDFSSIKKLVFLK